jgi:hypothetical protein
MNFSTEEPKRPGDEFEVLIYADELPAAAGEESEAIVLPAKEKKVELSLWLSGSEELEIMGGDRRRLTIRRDKPASRKLVFKVRVKPGAKVGARVVLTASFSYLGRPCGRVSRTFAVGKSAVKKTAAKNAAAKPAKKAVSKLRDYQGNLVWPEIPPPLADLTVLITCSSDTADKFNVNVSSPLLPEYRQGKSGTWILGKSSDVIVRRMFKKFVETQDLSQRRDHLGGAGKELFRAAPEVFKDAFWKIIAKGLALEKILIVSEEPHVPWELMIPNVAPKGIGETRRNALGVDYLIGRWIHEGHLVAPGSLSVEGGCVIRPDYDEGDLPSAKTEAKFICKNLGGKEFTPATYEELKARIDEKIAPLFHFAGHGRVDGSGMDQELLLENRDTITPGQLEYIEGFESGVKRTKPFVFLNACETGQSTPSLIGANGFPMTFVRLGASAVIAPLWSVDDEVASRVANALYGLLVKSSAGSKSRPIPDLLRELRQRSYEGPEAGDDSYAAYGFYGDPSFFLKLPQKKAAKKTVRK